MEPGRIIASGRDGDIYEFGPGLVLRKTRDGRSIEHEARTMEYVAAQGYPVPRIEEVRAGGTEIVMERLDGPMMMDAMLKRPQSMVAHTHVLADLHDQLHALAAPEWLPEIDAGANRLLHLDLHPMNVMMTTRGPVVIDWTNAARGGALTDVGLTYVLMTCPDMPAPWIVRTMVKPMRYVLARAFAKRYRGPALAAAIAHAAALKQLDAHMSSGELANIRRLETRMHRRAAKAPG